MRLSSIKFILLTAMFLGSLLTDGKPVSDDPSRDGWKTEVLSGEVSKQLQRISALLMQVHTVTPDQLDGLILENFRTAPLRPALKIVHQDRMITVRRRTPVIDDEGILHDGGAALEQLRRPYMDGYVPRVELKVVGVKLAGAVFRTSVLVNLFGRTPEGTLDENGTWECEWLLQDDVAPLLVSVAVAEFEQVALASRNPTIFADLSEAVLGANACYREQFSHSIAWWVQRIEFMQGIDVNGHFGIAVGDIDNDGLEDVYVAQGGGLPNRMLRHNPDGTVTDVSKAAGVDWMTGTNGVLLADFDNDGDQDLVAATLDGLLFNTNDTIGGDGDDIGKFTRAALIETTDYMLSLAAADYDNDGDLDLFACGYFSEENRGKVAASPVPYFDAVNGGKNILLRNDTVGYRQASDTVGNERAPDWRFTDVTNSVGLDKGATRFAMAAAFEDYDNDGDQDLYVANDFGPNLLYRNDTDAAGARYFTEVAAATGSRDRGFSMSAAWADVDHNGWMDLYVSNMYSAAGNRIVKQEEFVQDDPWLHEHMQYLARGNTLLYNHSGTFTDGSETAGVMMGRWGWASPFCDINNDSWTDILVGNGYLTNDNAHDL